VPKTLMRGLTPELTRAAKRRRVERLVRRDTTAKHRGAEGREAGRAPRDAAGYDTSDIAAAQGIERPAGAGRSKNRRPTIRDAPRDAANNFKHGVAAGQRRRQRDLAEAAAKPAEARTAERRKSSPTTRTECCRRTPELSRAAKRRRLGRIVRDHPPMDWLADPTYGSVPRQSDADCCGEPGGAGRGAWELRTYPSRAARLPTRSLAGSRPAGSQSVRYAAVCAATKHATAREKPFKKRSASRCER
jgi:hypothetical protein